MFGDNEPSDIPTSENRGTINNADGWEVNNVAGERPRTEESGKSFNFSSKLVKVTKEDMIEKPKRTRNWKGRRAAERKRAAEMLSACPSAEFSFRTHQFSQVLSVENYEACEYLENFILDDDRKQGRRTEGNCPNLSDIENYLRWLPSDTYPEMETTKHEEESQTKLEFCCGDSVDGPTLKPEVLKNGTCSLCRRKDPLPRSGSCSCRFLQFLYYIFCQELWEADQLKRQEDEIVRKIDTFLTKHKKNPREKEF